MKNIPSKANPRFGIIAPTAYLSYALQSNFHLVLAHLLDTDPTYTEFYRSMSDRGDFIICDNGAFELGESYAPDKLIALARSCNADAIVLPDYPYRQWDVTAIAASKMIDEVKSEGFQTFYCPQSVTGDWDGWVEGYLWGATNPDIDIIGMSILSLPNALPHIPAAYARVVGTEILQRTGVFAYEKYHHYLGLNAGPALEIPSLIAMNALNSCDSSGPVWAGICGHEYTRMADSYQSTRKVAKHVDFNYRITTNPNVLNAIQHNITLTLDLFE